MPTTPIVPPSPFVFWPEVRLIVLPWTLAVEVASGLRIEPSASRVTFPPLEYTCPTLRSPCVFVPGAEAPSIQTFPPASA